MAEEFMSMEEYYADLVGGAKATPMKKKGMAKGGATKMTLAKLRAAAKKMGYKLVKIK